MQPANGTSEGTSSALNVEQRIALTLAIQEYLHAADRFAEASQRFNKACSTLRQSLPKQSRFLLPISYRHYLVTSDREGNFDIELLESL